MANNPVQYLKKSASEFVGDYRRLAKASMSLIVILAVVSVFLGLWPVLYLHAFAEWVDAMLGARSIGVWTSDVNKYLWQQVGLLLLCIPALTFTRQLRGLVASLSQRTRELVFIVAVVIVAGQVFPITILAIVLFVLALMVVKNKWVRITMSVMMLLMPLQPLFVATQLVVLKELMLHEMIFWSGSLLMFAGYAALHR